MFCPKCGKELLEASNFCTACGYEIATSNVSQNVEKQNSKTVKIVITRIKKLIGCAIPMKIIIDGNKIASLKTKFPNHFEGSQNKKVEPFKLPNNEAGGKTEPTSLADAIKQSYETNN